MPTVFKGATPYCYANSLAMVLGADAPPPSAIEVLTGSPFGAQIERGLPYFDPLGWNPDFGLDQAIDLLGWTCLRTTGGEPAQAVGRLRQATELGPVLVGPVDIGLLLHQPWSTGTPNGGDHWVTVLGVDHETVLFHDPGGYPFATLPVDAFAAAWRERLPDCAGPFTMRSDFRRVDRVDIATALRRSLPAALGWLTGARGGQGGHTPAKGTLGGAAAVEHLVAGLRTGRVEDRALAHLKDFAVRVGARRLADASLWLAEIDEMRASDVAGHQARLLGSVQYSLVVGDTSAAATALRQLAVAYDELGAALGERP
ncbi:hypothetical protein [Streptomyces sporangiiformans]|uniref:Uncharacterized protein n=1 Tax=Streptomyces sporangiiformans TaxID=2315329 RepID=A0A505DQS0_9ACTN|nr:hypothetical protein [Streptomyces sporangiiformans]TPQ23577.1 hypothetical protein FGD71_003085 [Streptomyces sporangiiformans]